LILFAGQYSKTINTEKPTYIETNALLSSREISSMKHYDIVAQLLKAKIMKPVEKAVAKEQHGNNI
jgi:hypothetical protein